MELFSSNDSYKLYKGDMRNMLDVIQKESIDTVLTDPPYELNFMSKNWDNSGIAFQKETWEKCYEVLKPGGYLLAFGGSRTFHRIAVAIEDAGFEIRDTIMWLYGSGFPKSLNIGLAIDKKNGVDNRTGNIKTDGKATNSGSGCYNCNNGKDNSMKQEYEERIATNEWNGWGSSLKPSFEPIIVARKPFKGSLVDNVIEYGVGGINIDECRVDDKEGVKKIDIEENSASENCGFGCNGKLEKLGIGRFPANTIMTYNVDDYKEVCRGFKTKEDEYNARYFYCAKASKKDRDEGLDTFIEEKVNDGRQTPIDNAFQRGETLRKNTHPTVKPTELMQYLVRLVSPPNSTILDCFNGSGSTGKAVMYENKERNKNYKYIGIELTEEYLPIAKARIEYVCNLEPEVNPQMSIFDYEE